MSTGKQKSTLKVYRQRFSNKSLKSYGIEESPMCNWDYERKVSVAFI